MTETQKGIYKHFVKLGMKKLKEEENNEGQKKRATGGQDSLKAIIAMKKIVNHPCLIEENAWPIELIPAGLNYQRITPELSGKLHLLEQMIFQMR
jgi:hypothetical protein